MSQTLLHLDANVFADYARGQQPNVARRFEGALRTHLGVSAVVIGELLVGGLKAKDPLALQNIRDRLEDIRVVVVDDRISEWYAQIRVNLESLGQKMNANDLWIAATALAEDAILVTADEAFSRIPGLKTENWR